MAPTRRHPFVPAQRALPALVGLVALALALWLAPAASAAPGGIDTDTTDPAGVRSYWTAERMREATPAEPLTADDLGGKGSDAEPSIGAPATVEGVEPGSGAVPQIQRGEAASASTAGAAERRASGYTRSEVTDPSDESVRMQGKVFLTVTGGSVPGDYVCSGTAISSNNQSVVWTAGHCVFDTDGGGYVTNFMFVPAYHDGTAPFGEWPAVKLASPDAWRSDANSSYDFSAAQVATNGSGQTLNEVVGGRGIGFNQSRHQEYSSFGYPAQQPPLEFTGGREFRCDSALGGTDNPPGSGPNTNWIGCDMTGGSSGGGWIVAGTLLSVNSYSYCDITGLICQARLYGPYLDDTAKKLYKSIAGEATYCQNKKVTILGTDAAEKIVGTSGKDVIAAGAGNDTIVAKGGKDKICAGKGKDVVKGQGGKDKLHGNNGRDKLYGGKGKDTCNGGKGKDKAFSCEKKRKI